jgi:hypothetical protein
LSRATIGLCAFDVAEMKCLAKNAEEYEKKHNQPDEQHYA